jgi:RNA polymerase sigma factor (TIGR02999 family)
MALEPESTTQVLAALGGGDPKAAEQLLPLVYQELRRLAAARMAHEDSGQTLQPTALVHEAWLRLVKSDDPVFQNRAHFFAAAAEAMRRILIENARRRQRVKHGGGQERVNLADIDVAATTNDETLIAVSDALDKLAGHDPQGAALIRLRFFGGLSNVEAAEIVGLPERTAKRTWAYARAWLHEELKRTI